jgi:hypothetical protein
LETLVTMSEANPGMEEQRSCGVVVMEAATHQKALDVFCEVRE